VCVFMTAKWSHPLSNAMRNFVRKIRKLQSKLLKSGAD
jgi:hypothetical protein